MHNYLTKLTQLQLSYQEAMTRAQSFVDPGLSSEGLAKRRQELTSKAAAEHKAHLEKLAQDFDLDASEAKRLADKEIPPAPGDVAPAWAMAQMLLDTGQTIHQVVRGADQAMLHAISQWGPTYLQAQALKGRNDSSVPATIDPATLQRSIRQRWAEVLGDAAAERIQTGAEAEAAEAQFRSAAQHFDSKLGGVRTGVDDLTAAVEAKLAGQRVAASYKAPHAEAGAA